MVRDAIARNLVSFSKMLRSHDLKDTGLMGRSHLEKIVLTFCPLLTRGRLSK